jgi:uncharacterized membrane protein
MLLDCSEEHARLGGDFTTMRLRLQNILLLINILVIALIIIITFVPYDLPRIILGLPFVMFFPGYTLIAALFPKRDDIDSIERVALSFGVSIAIVVFIVLMLNYSPWGIKLYPILISLGIFILVTSLIAWQRQRRLPEIERPTISLNSGLFPPGKMRSLRMILSFVFVVAILGAIGALGYFLMTPKPGDNFTEYYVLGLGGKATNYPTELRKEEEGRVIVGIVNHEHQQVTYRLEVVIDGVENNSTESETLEHGDQWEEIVTFTPYVVGDNQKVEFLLYRLNQNEVYQRLHLWINVKE